MKLKDERITTNSLVLTNKSYFALAAEHVIQPRLKHVPAPRAGDTRTWPTMLDKSRGEETICGKRAGGCLLKKYRKAMTIQNDEYIFSDSEYSQHYISVFKRWIRLYFVSKLTDSSV